MPKQTSTGAAIKISFEVITVLSGLSLATPDGNGALSGTLVDGDTMVGDFGCLFTFFLRLCLVISCSILKNISPLRFEVLLYLSTSSFLTRLIA